MKRKSKDVARKRKRVKIGEERRKSTDKGIFKNYGSLASTAASSGGRFIPPVPDRTWGEFGTEVGGTLLGTAAGAAVGGIGGAIEGYELSSNVIRGAQWGQRLYNSNSLFDKEKTTVVPIMSVSYSGKMRPSKGKSTNKLRAIYQANGAVAINESYGNVVDPDVVGVGHITWNQECVQRTIVYAILRKVFLQSGIICQTPYEIIRMINTVDSGGFRLEWNLQDADGTITTGLYNIPVGTASLEFLYINSGLAAVISNMIFATNPAILERVMLMYDSNRVAGQLIMRQQRIDITVNAHTVIQNRTKSAAGSTDIDQIDTQPLKGPVFEFNGLPKTKEITPLALNISYGTGSILFRKGQLPGSDIQSWSEPPVRASFYNVKKGSYVRLAPGVLKDMESAKTWKGPFQSVLRRWRVLAEGTTITSCPGNATVAYLEEEMNSGSANNITVHYETQHTVGCKLTTVKAPNLQPFYAALPFNNQA